MQESKTQILALESTDTQCGSQSLLTHLREDFQKTYYFDVRGVLCQASIENSITSDINNNKPLSILKVASEEPLHRTKLAVTLRFKNGDPVGIVSMNVIE